MNDMVSMDHWRTFEGERENVKKEEVKSN